MRDQKTHIKNGQAITRGERQGAMLPLPQYFRIYQKGGSTLRVSPQCLSQNDMPKYVFVKVECGLFSFLIKWTNLIEFPISIKFSEFIE